MVSRDEEINRRLKKVAECEEKGKLKDAIKELEKAIKINPNEGNLYNRLGDLHIKNNDIKKATEAFKHGVVAYRKDNFSRNAIALCKKILRYDPANIDTYKTIAEVLVELDERSDALIYYSVYAEKQLAQKDEKEVIKTLDQIEKIGNLDGKMIKKVHEIYKSLGRNDLAKKFLDKAMVEGIDIEETTRLKREPEPIPKPRLTPKETAPVHSTREEPHELEIEDITSFAKEEVKVQVDTERLDSAVREVETAISQLRKAMRLDEVIIALDKSMTALSDEQKKAIALLQRSLSTNIDALQKSIKELHESYGKNAREQEGLLKDFSKALISMTKDQAIFADKIDDSLKRVTNSFNESTDNAVSNVKEMMTEYHKSSEKMCSTLNESKDSNIVLTKTTEVMKNTVHKMNEILLAMNDSMTRFIIAQESKEKKQSRYTIIVIAIITIICGFLIVSVFK
jgi:tetratricopeptide (TPR) repeat protein